MSLANNLTAQPTHKWIWPILMIGLVGLIDAGYLTYTHYAGEIVGCSGQTGCEDVLNSPFSTIGEIPIALFGALYYATILGLTFLANRGWAPSLTCIRWLSLSGLVISSYLVYLQVSVINAICQYCMVSFGASLLLATISWFSGRGPSIPTIVGHRPRLQPPYQPRTTH
jgi:uncharacterized membrane protein